MYNITVLICFIEIFIYVLVCVKLGTELDSNLFDFTRSSFWSIPQFAGHSITILQWKPSRQTHWSRVACLFSLTNYRKAE